uniref:Uncharacterized protein n=1 Tax=Panagrolaimus sp. JU765 TaxID=591449 RepID=A0AC34RSX8_9BILA
METSFANSMIKGRSELNGSAPVFLNYCLPFIMAAIPTAITYFTNKKYYGASGIHCFVIVYSNMFWGWTFSAWGKMMIGTLLGQLAFLACIQERDDVNKPQLYWAK